MMTMEEYKKIANKKRVKRAKAALLAYIENSSLTEDDDNVVDLVTDLLHLIHNEGTDINKIIRIATTHFYSEKL